MRLKYATVGTFVSLATLALSGVTYADPIDPAIFETTTCALGGPAAESGQCVFTAAQGGASLAPFVGMTVTTADGSAATGGDFFQARGARGRHYHCISSPALSSSRSRHRWPCSEPALPPLV